MEVIADMHIHGRYSRACSKDLSISSLEKYARLKGITLLGTGDFTHPLWQKEIRDHLIEDGSGILKTKTGFCFVLQTEISLIYSQGGRGRRVHNLVFAPNMAVVEQITAALLKHGRVDYDGRPIFKIPCPDFVAMLREISEDIEVIPAHIWTPWFSLFGSNSGFNTVQECFQDQTQYIHALETGLSSDPPMNWRLSQLDSFHLVSFSDSHSFWPWRLGREATVFDLPAMTYQALLAALRTTGPAKTIEVDPNFGKYHFTGHRNCEVCVSPTEAVTYKNICPKCGKQLTVGVDQRVEELADRPLGFKPATAKPFVRLLPLAELLSAYLNKAVSTKAVMAAHDALIAAAGSELGVLLDFPAEKVAELVDYSFADLLLKNREGGITISPGYDGLYGVPLLNAEAIADHNKKKLELKPLHKQMSLGDF